MEHLPQVFKTRLARGWIVWPPTAWGKVHAGITLIFFVATFGAILGGWAQSIRIVMGWPETMFWIMLWMVIMTLNLIWMYYTSCKGWAERLEHTEIEQVRGPWDTDVNQSDGGIANA